MKKTATLNLRKDPDVRKGAENVLDKSGIPFKVSLSEAPVSINADEMSDMQLNNKLEAGYTDMKTGRTRRVNEAFMKFRKEHQM